MKVHRSSEVPVCTEISEIENENLFFIKLMVREENFRSIVHDGATYKKSLIFVMGEKNVKNPPNLKMAINFFPQTFERGIGAHFFYLSMQNKDQKRKKRLERAVMEPTVSYPTNFSCVHICS